MVAGIYLTRHWIGWRRYKRDYKIGEGDGDGTLFLIPATRYILVYSRASLLTLDEAVGLAWHCHAPSTAG